jgi:hypothetical protein
MWSRASRGENHAASRVPHDLADRNSGTRDNSQNERRYRVALRLDITFPRSGVCHRACLISDRRCERDDDCLHDAWKT